MASPKVIVEAALPTGLFVLAATAAPIIKLPALIVVVPVYEFAAESVQEPSPDFVKVPDVVAITLLSVAVPVPVNTKLNVFPVTPPDKVNAPLPDASIVPPLADNETTLSDECPEPVYLRIPVAPIENVPFPTVAGAPNELLPPPTA